MWAMIKAGLSLLKGSWIPAALGALLLAACAWAYVQGVRLDRAKADAKQQVQAEQTAHAATASELVRERRKVAILTQALEQAREGSQAVREALREALARESEAVSAAAARKEIMDRLRARARTEAEKQEVIDDDTRRAVVSRLNRPL